MEKREKKREEVREEDRGRLKKEENREQKREEEEQIAPGRKGIAGFGMRWVAAEDRTSSNPV